MILIMITNLPPHHNPSPQTFFALATPFSPILQWCWYSYTSCHGDENHCTTSIFILHILISWSTLSSPGFFNKILVILMIINSASALWSGKKSLPWLYRRIEDDMSVYFCFVLAIADGHSISFSMYPVGPHLSSRDCNASSKIFSIQFQFYLEFRRFKLYCKFQVLFRMISQPAAPFLPTISFHI